MSQPSVWDRAVAYVRARCAAAAKTSYNNQHPSFAVRGILHDAERRFNLPTYGVEGWCTQMGRNGVSYLNAGDPYALTIYVRTTPFRAQVSLGCWGGLV